jgi:hypothetical protein
MSPVLGDRVALIWFPVQFIATVTLLHDTTGRATSRQSFSRPTDI